LGLVGASSGNDRIVALSAKAAREPCEGVDGGPPPPRHAHQKVRKGPTMFTKSILAVAAVIAATAVGAHGSFSVPAPSDAAPSRPFAPVVDQRLPVQADDGAQVTIRFGDLDLASPAGAQTMQRRLHNAAWRVCGGPSADHEPCVRRVVDEALTSLAGRQAPAHG
jgi:UrcA family protein